MLLLVAVVAAVAAILANPEAVLAHIGAFLAHPEPILAHVGATLAIVGAVLWPWAYVGHSWATLAPCNLACLGVTFAMLS